MTAIIVTLAFCCSILLLALRAAGREAERQRRRADTLSIDNELLRAERDLARRALEQRNARR